MRLCVILQPRLPPPSPHTFQRSWSQPVPTLTKSSNNTSTIHGNVARPTLLVWQNSVKLGREGGGRGGVNGNGNKKNSALITFFISSLYLSLALSFSLLIFSFSLFFSANFSSGRCRLPGASPLSPPPALVCINNCPPHSLSTYPLPPNHFLLHLSYVAEDHR